MPLNAKKKPRGHEPAPENPFTRFNIPSHGFPFPHCAGCPERKQSEAEQRAIARADMTNSERRISAAVDEYLSTHKEEALRQVDRLLAEYAREVLKLVEPGRPH